MKAKIVSITKSIDFLIFLYYTFQQHLYKPYSAMSTLIPGSNNIIPIML